MTSLQTFTKDVLCRFPLKEIQYAFCYGSAAFQQTGSQMKNNVLDFIFVVDSSQRFHTENLSLNHRDYSFLKYLGCETVCKVQGTGVYFNTLVPFGSRTIKYGVVSSLDFKSDLLGEYVLNIFAANYTSYWVKKLLFYSVLFSCFLQHIWYTDIYSILYWNLPVQINTNFR